MNSHEGTHRQSEREKSALNLMCRYLGLKSSALMTHEFTKSICDAYLDG